MVTDTSPMPSVGAMAVARSASVSALSSWMLRPAKVTASASGVSPLPPHRWHGPETMCASAASRRRGLDESASVCST